MKKFFTRKKIVWGSIILLVIAGVGYKVVKGNDASKNILTEAVLRQYVKQTVLATGQVVSGTDLELSFKTSGVVRKINAKEGDKVKASDILAALDQKDQLAALTSARGTLAQAKASYQKILDGASSEEVAVAQKAVDTAQVTLDNANQSLKNTKQQQDVAVNNAYRAMLNSTLAAIADSFNTGSVTATVTGTYTGDGVGQYKINIYSTGSGLRFQVSGLESGDGLVSTSPTLMGTKGLYIQFSSTEVPTNNSWTVSIPNTQASTYLTNKNAYEAAVAAKQSAVDAAQAQVAAAQAALGQAQASLDLKKASARPADIDAARAQILSAEGQVQAAEASLENTVLRAPVDGTITLADVKAGELATALKGIMVLQDVGNLHVEANISEANVANLRQGQKVDLTFDALGMERHFEGTIQAINPASTVVSGVVNYKVTANMDKMEEIKPGMTANMVILITEKSGVLAAPQRAIVPKEGKKYIRVVTDTKKKTYRETEIVAGMEVDGGLVEILSGLSEGQEIVTLIKK